MSTSLKIILIFLLPVLVQSQSNNIDSLRAAFNNAPGGGLGFKATSNIYFLR